MRGYDGGKKVKGRKRYLLVDSNGLLMHVLVHEANIQDQYETVWGFSRAPVKMSEQ